MFLRVIKSIINRAPNLDRKKIMTDIIIHGKLS